MSKIEEARAALDRTVTKVTGTGSRGDVMELADAYALQSHVHACTERNETPDLPPKTPVRDYKCPDGSEHSMTDYPNTGGAVMEVSNCTKCGTPSESVMMRRQRSKAHPQHCGYGWYCADAPGVSS
ncbi:hypothetical protein LCGC14_0288740 [marine sediment metagenome]|uniref:Uncharacterized protein n=1 Tax=marine sediment metagenome TaxID=412755 RepID=A0A0F9UAP6_9ZZZZ